MKTRENLLLIRCSWRWLSPSDFNFLGRPFRFHGNAVLMGPLYTLDANKKSLDEILA